MNKEILDGNKLIVEFMEIKPTEQKGMYSISQHNYTCLGNTPEMALNEFASISKYHESWDWLMPVLEKIEAKGRRWEIGISPYSTSHHYCKIWSIGTIERISLLDAVYSAVLEFIKWYNSNKQTNDNARINHQDKGGMKKPNISIDYLSEKSQIISTNDGEFLFSYGTLIAGIINGKVYLNEKYWDYSVTTGKHRNKFLGEGIAETRKKIKSGEYQFFE